MRLADYLRTNKIKASAFGAVIDVTNKQTMSRYVRGERFPPARVLKAIHAATAGQVTAEDFVEQHTATATKPASLAAA